MPGVAGYLCGQLPICPKCGGDGNDYLCDCPSESPPTIKGVSSDCERFDNLVKEGLCGCGSDHETGKVIMSPPAGRAYSRKDHKPPNKVNLFINGFPPHASSQYVEELINRASGVKGACRYVRSVDRHAYAFVDVPTLEEAVKVYIALDGHRLGFRSDNKRFITVREARDRR